VLTASATVGFAFLLMELVWYRMLGPLLGGTVFTFGLILAVALFGIALGGALYATLGRTRAATLNGFALTCLLEAVALAIPFALGDRLAVLALVLRPLGNLGFWGHVTGWTIVSLIVVLPAAIVSGFQFPLIIALLGRGRAEVGRQIGLAYACNTAGAMIGSLAGGFGVIPWLSAPGTWRFVCGSLVIFGVAAVAISRKRAATFSPAPQLALAAVAGLLLFATGPTAAWRHSGIGAGRAPAYVLSSPNQLREWRNLVRRMVVWDADGRESSVALEVESRGYTFVVNGKSDGSARVDAGTQVMLGMLGAVLHTGPRKALVVGLGTGSTAGWLGAVPDIQRVDVIELEPVILDVARVCSLVNRDVMSNPKVRIDIGDAREVLLTARERYDLIASEPSNPYRAGVASLFTREYYRSVAARLEDGGIFVQWLQAYEVDARTMRTVYATLLSVFPVVETWQTSGSDLVLVAAKQPIGYDVARLRSRLRMEPYKSAMQHAWRAVDLEGFFAHHLSRTPLAQELGGGRRAEINTDDRNLVEFGFARTVGDNRPIIIPEIRAIASARGEQHPASSGGEVDWERVDDGWIAFQAAEGFVFPVPAFGSAGQRARHLAELNYYRSNDPRGALAAWRAQDREPVDPTELAMLADALAETGDDGAVLYIERLRAYEPSEADGILARLRSRQGRQREAVDILERAIRAYQTDPWALNEFKRHSLALASELVARDARAAPKLYAALRVPFAVRAADEDRVITAARMTMALDFPSKCREAINPLEPYVPWTRGWLSLRSDCSAATSDPRSAAAEADLREFLAREPIPLAGLLAPAAKTAAAGR
jgi:spermidine synthase